MKTNQYTLIILCMSLLLHNNIFSMQNNLARLSLGASCFITSLCIAHIGKDIRDEYVKQETTKELDNALIKLISPTKQESLNAAKQLTQEFIALCYKRGVDMDTAPDNEPLGFYTKSKDEIWRKTTTRRRALKDLAYSYNQPQFEAESREDGIKCGQFNLFSYSEMEGKKHDGVVNACIPYTQAIRKTKVEHTSSLKREN